MDISSIIVNFLIGLMFLLASGIFLWAHFSSKGRYDEYIEPLDEEEFKLKKLLHIGIFLDEKINLFSFMPTVVRENLAKYNNDIRSKLTEIYGFKYVDYYVMIHNGSKWSIFLLGFFITTVIAGVSSMKDDLSNATIFLVLSSVIGIGLAFLLDKQLNDKIEKRRLAIQMEFPEFINKLLLLVNAGMTISRAWEKIINDNKKESPLYNELNMSLAEIRAGKPEAAAYEDFARRCKIKEVIKFISVIILNLKKGGAEVVPTLRAQADECWEMRKSAARRLGEQASTKLMLPMAIMLLGMIIIVIVPAILQLAI